MIHVSIADSLWRPLPSVTAIHATEHLVINDTADVGGPDLASFLADRFSCANPIAGNRFIAQLEPGLTDLRPGSVLVSGCVRRSGRSRHTLPGLVLVTHTGPDAGRIVELKPGSYWLGRPGEEQCAGPKGAGILVSDPAMSRVHARLEVSATGVVIFDHNSSNGLWVDGRRIRIARLSTSSRVRAGNTMFQLHAPGTDPAPSNGSAEISSALDSPVKVQGTPPQRPGTGTLAAAFLPLGLGIALAVSTGMWFFLAFSGIGALTAGAGLLSYRRRLTAFRCAEGKAMEADRRRRHALHPTLGRRCLSALVGSGLFGPALPGSSLRFSVPSGSFRREPSPNTMAESGDRSPFVALRLGTGSRPGDLVLQKPDEGWRPPMLAAVPVLLEAQAGSTVCLTGHPGDVQGLCRSLLLQLGSIRTPDGPAVVLLGTRADELICDARFLPGVQLLPARQEEAAAAALAGLASARSGTPLLVIAPPGVWETGRRIRDGLPKETRGLTCLIACRDTLSGNETSPPDSLHPGDADISLGADGGMLTVAGQSQQFLPDLLGALAFHRAALRLALPAAETPLAGELGTAVEPADVLKAWDQNSPYRAVIGHAGGRLVGIDLVEDGPHVLIAGTTGSGKSELLRTFVSSLACHVPPSGLHFLLIDFKGGSGLASLADLPHTAGFLTDLSQENVSRALTSLRAELRRRERLLAGVLAEDLDEFNKRTAPGAALPRLVVVVDEFRMLADAVPNAIQELMKIAALGRSLGLHLVMATQRPQGAVTADIRANVSAGICLRVQSATDSRDVVGCDDAAAIPASSPGMAVLRLPGAAPLTFQASTTTADPQQLPLVQTLEEFLSTPAPVAKPPLGPGLERIVNAVKGAALSAGFPEKAQSPVMPPLPADLHPISVPPTGCLRIGLADQPEEQAQVWLDWAPKAHSHLALLGRAEAGSVSAASVLGRQHVAHLPSRHLYVLDGDGSLAWATGLPQTGAYVPPQEPARASRVLSVLAGILLERLAAPQSDPGITLLVSGWGRWQESFRSLRSSNAEDLLHTLARDGAAGDICLLVSGNRELTTARFFQLLPNRLWFPAGLSEDALLSWPRLPDLQPVPGRAFVQGPITPGAVDGSNTVAQCYQRGWPAGPAPLPEGTPRPRRIDGLPPSVLRSHLEAASGPCSFPVGLGGDELKTVEAQVPPGSVFVVLGPPRSGKTTLLETFAAAARLPSGEADAAAASPKLCRIGAGNKAPDTNTGPPPPAGSLNGWLVLADDADQLPAEDHQLIIQLAARGASVVLSAVPAYNLPTRLPSAHRSRIPGNGVLLAPSQVSDSEFFGVRLEPEGRPRPGRGYLFTGGTAVEVQFAAPGGEQLPAG